jgi:3',5'-cyclic AMP phosphodiesterase CpdA
MTRIIALSDIHLSPIHGFFWENWCIARDFADHFNADAVIVNGDLCINGPDSDDEMAFAARALRGLRSPVLTVPGNHDVGDEPPGQDAHQLVDAARLARWHRFIGTDRWTFEAGVWRLIGVNAQLFGSGLPEEAEQDNWLDTQLANRGGAPAALITHKPLFLESPDEQDSSVACTGPIPRASLLPRLRNGGIRLVVSGHLHQFRDRTIDGIRHLWLPAVAFVTSHPLGGDPRSGVTVLDFDGDEVRAQIEYPLGMVSHELDAIKGHGRYAFLRDMPPCPPPVLD